jgi:hypothetical protein
MKHEHPERYAMWGGNPRGDKPDLACCIERVTSHHISYQCSRKLGHGPEGMYCKQHGKMVQSVLDDKALREIETYYRR